jgi:hypothetical protein
MKKRSKLVKFLTRTFRIWKQLKDNSTSYTPTHRVINIEQDEKSDYIISIQLIGKNFVQKVSPEELLADDQMVNRFSPTDIRTLTYLGYLDINSPKYKILAKRLSKNHDQTLFALQKKGEKKYSVLTANEITKQEGMITSLSQEEAYMLGVTSAHEQQTTFEKQKKALLEKAKES